MLVDFFSSEAAIFPELVGALLWSFEDQRQSCRGRLEVHRGRKPESFRSVRSCFGKGYFFFNPQDSGKECWQGCEGLSGLVFSKLNSFRRYFRNNRITGATWITPTMYPAANRKWFFKCLNWSQQSSTFLSLKYFWNSHHLTFLFYISFY